MWEMLVPASNLVEYDRHFTMYCSSVEDEQHFMMHCSSFDDLRDTLFDNLASFSEFMKLNDPQTFIFLMSCSSGDTEAVNLVLNFVNQALKRRFYLLTTS